MHRCFQMMPVFYVCVYWRSSSLATTGQCSSSCRGIKACQEPPAGGITAVVNRVLVSVVVCLPAVVWVVKLSMIIRSCRCSSSSNNNIRKMRKLAFSKAQKRVLSYCIYFWRTTARILSVARGNFLLIASSIVHAES